jgi:hypothetical protein
LNVSGRFQPRLLNALRLARTAADQKCGEGGVERQEKTKGVSHGGSRLLLSQSDHPCKVRFATRRACRYLRGMLELEVYAAGVRDLNKILELEHELEPVAGLRYKVDSNHDVVYLEFDEPTVTFREIRASFRKLGLDPRFIGTIPSELRPRSKTQLLTV